MPAEQSSDLATLSTQALQGLLDNLASAKQFALDQAPDVCQQYVMWGIASHLILALVGLSLLLCGLIGTYICVKALYNDRTGDTAWVTGLVVFPGAGCIVGLCMVGSNLYDAAYPYFAPKVYLIETITHLIRHG